MDSVPGIITQPQYDPEEFDVLSCIIHTHSVRLISPE